MKLSGSERFSVEKLGDEPNWEFYKIEERQADQLLRSFTGRITQTQATRPQVKEAIARWCEIYSDKLPDDGGITVVDIDLNNVQRR